MTTRGIVSQSVTVSIVSHNQLSMIIPLLDQLSHHCSSAIAKIILTVNLPENDLLSARIWNVPLEVIRNDQPQGFGANHNAAFNRCTSDWFLVLNPDIRISDDVLSRMLSKATTPAGLLAPRIIEPGKSHPEPHRGLLTPLEILRRKRPGYPAPLSASWVPGMFMLCRSEAYRQIEGFDTRFFMYGEDFDICARMLLAGWELQIDDETYVEHAAQRDSRRRMPHLYWHVASLAKLWVSPSFWRYRSLLRRK